MTLDVTRVLVVDDHAIVRTGIRRLLEIASRRFEVAEAEDGESALAQVRRRTPELMVLDLHLPTARGTDVLCREVVAASPRTRILIFTAFADAEAICTCLKEGARGCTLKDAATIDVVPALMRIEAGEIVIEPRVAQQVAAGLTQSLRDDDGLHLTNRERDVLRLLGDGMSNRQIADRLFLSEHTVKGYVTSLLHKLGARSRLEAVAVATHAGVLTPRRSRGAEVGAMS